MNKDDIAKKLANDIYNSRDIEKTLQEVKEYINKLVYSDNQKPISKTDKKEIIEKIKIILQGYNNILFESDNSSYIELLNMMSDYLDDDEDE